MKRLLFTGILLLFIPFAFSSPPQKEWTIMVYMAADNNLNDFAELDLKEMLRNQLPSSANLIVQIDNSTPCNWADWITCRRLEIKPGLSYKTQYVSDIGEINTGDPVELTKFIDWTVEHYPAKKYGLIIWDHGDGWRAANLQKKKVIKPLYKAIASDDEAGDILYMHEVSDAIKNCRHNFKHDQFEFIGFDACLMGMLEVWYELKDYSKYGIGSEGLEPGVGWPYDGVVDALNKSTSDTKKFCQEIVNSYHDYFTRHPDFYTLSVVDLSKIAGLARELSDLVPYLLQQPENVTKARARTGVPYGFDPKDSWPNGVDLKKFLVEFRSISSIAQTSPKIDTFLNHYKEAVVENAADSVNESEKGSYGIAIYFPENADIFSKDPDASGYLKFNTDNPVAFVKNEKWADFINYWCKPRDDSKISAVDDHVTRGARRANTNKDMPKKLISPLNPHPSQGEIQLYRKMEKIYAKYMPGRNKMLYSLIKNGLNSYGNDTLLFLKSLRNVMLAYFENPELGVLSISDLSDFASAIKKTLHSRSIEELNKDLFAVYSWINEKNNEGEFSPPTYGVLSTIGEFVVRLEKDTVSRMLMNMLMADNYSKMEDGWLADNTQVRTALNVQIKESEEREDFNRDVCFQRAASAYNRTASFIKGLPDSDRRKGVLSYLTYYALMKLYGRYSFLYNEVLAYIKKVETSIPAFLQRDTISNYEYLKIYSSKIFALYRAKRYEEIKTVLPSYYKYIEIEQPNEKIILNNGVVDFENAGSASAIFPNAKVFASPAKQNEDLKAFNYTVSAIYLASRKSATPKMLIDAFEHSRLVESPINSQLVGTPHETDIYKLLDDLDSISAFEYDRLTQKKKKAYSIDTSRINRTNFAYFYYSYFGRTLYAVLKNEQRWTVDTIVYPEFFEFQLQRENNIDKRFAVAREEKIYSVIDNFFSKSNKKDVLVIPCDFLFQLPLEGISDGKDHYLVEKYKFLYAFNLQNKYTPFVAKSKRMICVSSPIEFTDIFPYLPHTKPEVQQILQNVSNYLTIDTVSGGNATDVQILKKIKNYNIVHFASHSYFTAQRPFASGIVLSKDSNSDGIITAYDMIRNLNADQPIDLVTLSSCQGADGTVVSNGALGLTYALLNSNVSNVISSVEEVNDNVGKTFMDILYQRIAAGEDLATGIQTAKLAIKNQYNSRKFWCNFNLYTR